MCGERRSAAARRPVADGSSPRVRGTRPHDDRHPGQDRFIPACAGNALSISMPAIWATVHPRVCGERSLETETNGRVSGSSPRVRGTPSRGPRISASLRFIPACAGNAIAVRDRRRRAAVHPRVCGERVRRLRPGGERVGSSPRVRGTPNTGSSRQETRRFIPACAGNASTGSPSISPTTVHPRVCGERRAIGGARNSAHGSSPRVRGTRSRRSAAQGDPAVHPRVCGERPSILRTAAVAVGSSPRVRGTRFVEGSAVPPWRFIPACAGNAAADVGPFRAGAVHPRLCGERGPVRDAPEAGGGSSPRVRGTLQPLPHRSLTSRFIPACAGNARCP